MSRLSFVLLMVTSLVLTVYFGAAAWRLTRAHSARSKVAI